MSKKKTFKCGDKVRIKLPNKRAFTGIFLFYHERWVAIDVKTGPQKGLYYLYPVRYLTHCK